MIFLGVVPLAFAAFGKLWCSCSIGAPDMTFPKLKCESFWAFGVGGVSFDKLFVGRTPAKALDILQDVVGYRGQRPGTTDFQRNKPLVTLSIF